jgi:hypothetical protein
MTFDLRRLAVPLGLAAALLLSACGAMSCPAGDGGPSASCCQPNGNSCAKHGDCCSGNCITRSSPGFCCKPGGCP